MADDHQLMRCGDCYTTYAVAQDETLNECSVCGGGSIENVDIELPGEFEKFERD